MDHPLPGAEGPLVDWRRVTAKAFRRRYREADLRLLAETDELRWTLSGPTTLALLQRAWHVFGDERFRRLSTLSNGHLYNLRRSRTYQRWHGRKDAIRPATGRATRLSAG